MCSDWKIRRAAVGSIVACSLLTLATLTVPGTVTAQESDVQDVVVTPTEEAGAVAGHTAAAGHSEGDDHGAPPPLLSLDIGSAFWNLLIFLAVLSVLGKFVWPNVLSGLKSREEKIRGDLESAEKANAKALSMLAEYQRKLDEAANQVQSMLAEARRGAESTGQRIVEESKQEAERQRERAIAEIETAKKVAIADIAGQTTDLAMQVARSVVGRELKPEDHADLIRQSLERLPSNN